SINLRDRFEWDVGSDMTPEEFAKQLAADLGIGGEFVSMISHEIHEQLYRFKQERLLGRGFEPEPLYSGFRTVDDGKNWSPALETLTAEEYERILEDKDRSIRRNRRATTSQSKRRGGTIAMSYNVPGYSSKITKRGRLIPLQCSLIDAEQYEKWQCQQCGLGAHSTFMIRSGPTGEKTLCNFCGLHYTVHGSLPMDRKDLFKFSVTDTSTDAETQAEIREGIASSALSAAITTPTAAPVGA
ncbi:Chromatin structure remodeling complex protein sfh1, partial [Lobosporangium transversale]